MSPKPELTQVMSHWTIYQNPVDYPDYPYVMRRWVLMSDSSTAMDQRLACIENEEGLNNIRATLERYGLTRIPRMPEDDPAILEVWI